MAVRKIPRSYRHLTGRIAKAGQDTSAAFEGGLERDFYTLLDFDPNVAKVDHQPVRLAYRRPDGTTGPYTPDTLVEYRPGTGLRPKLCEVKMREDLKTNWVEYRPKFKAAVHFAKQHGWLFKIYTDVEIRTPYLENVYLLREHRFQQVDELKRQRLLKPIQGGAEASLQKLIEAVCPVVKERGPWLSLIWHLIAIGELQTDLFSKLSYQSRVRLPQGI